MQIGDCNVTRFTFEVNTFGEAVSNPLDVRDLLLKVIGRIELDIYYPGATQSILDANGNCAGSWKFHIEGV